MFWVQCPMFRGTGPIGMGMVLPEQVHNQISKLFLGLKDFWGLQLHYPGSGVVSVLPPILHISSS